MMMMMIRIIDAIITSMFINLFVVHINYLFSITDDSIWIPRIKFRFRYNNGNSFAILRTQFPLRLAYCLTYNKSQGQTCDKLILDTTYPPFSHGHFYVAMTRCRDYRNIALFCNDDQIIKDDNFNIIGVNLPNIMHKEILQEFN